MPAGTQWELINLQNTPWLPQPYYTICKDTVLRQGIWCSEIIPGGNCAPMSGQTQYMYEQDRRVYFEYQGAFYLIFDFNKVAGESYMTHFVDVFLKLDSAIVTIDSVTTTPGPCPTRIQVPFKQTSSGLAMRYSDNIVEGQGYSGSIFPEWSGCDPLSAGILCFYSPNTCHTIPCIVSTIEVQYKASNLVISPNPGSDILRFDKPLSGILTISDIHGLVWYQSKVAHLNELEVAHFPKGLYFVSLEQEGQPTKLSKWVKAID